ncbi:hypothetical protein PFISCL1PPCAC_4123, partial [Pristionchus fissidentatus]
RSWHGANSMLCFWWIQRKRRRMLWDRRRTSTLNTHRLWERTTRKTSSYYLFIFECAIRGCQGRSRRRWSWWRWRRVILLLFFLIPLVALWLQFWRRIEPG